VTDVLQPETAGVADERASFARLLADLRPRLHRYCARMTGSVIDGEDAVQEALTHAFEAFEGLAGLDNPEGWVFRIAHNAALDFLRRRARQRSVLSDEEVPTMADPSSPIDERIAVAANLRTFMRLPAAQRSCVILMDVLGYTLKDIEGITGSSLPAIKASLHRGRANLRELAVEPDHAPTPAIGPREHVLLAAYVDRFNARDFDAVRDMLAEDVRIEVVSRTTLKGKAEVAGTYLLNYASASDWRFVPSLVEGWPAMLACDPANPNAAPRYFVLLEWAGDSVVSARDFRHASYVIDGAEVVRLA